MRAHKHRNNNDVLAPPPGATPEQCAPLPITRVKFDDGDRAVVSYWMPSAAELALLIAGHPVRLCVLGTTHAPVHLGVDGDGEFQGL